MAISKACLALTEIYQLSSHGVQQFDALAVSDGVIHSRYLERQLACKLLPTVSI